MPLVFHCALKPRRNPRPRKPCARRRVEARTDLAAFVTNTLDEAGFKRLRDAAREIGVGERTMRRVRNGERISLETLRRIAIYCGLSLADAEEMHEK